MLLSKRVQMFSSTCINNIITPHTLNGKDAINNNNVTSYENIIVTTPYKQEYMLRNNVDNDNMVDDCELITSKPHSKIKNQPTYSNNLDNEKLNLGLNLQKRYACITK